MVKNVMSLSGNGVADWFFQRVSAVILVVYTVFLIGFFLATPEFTYEAWSGLFANIWMKMFTLLAVLAFAAHAWIGLWTVLTDYVKQTALRIALQLFVALVLFIYFVIAFSAVWGA